MKSNRIGKKGLGRKLVSFASVVVMVCSSLALPSLLAFSNVDVAPDKAQAAERPVSSWDFRWYNSTGGNFAANTPFSNLALDKDLADNQSVSISSGGEEVSLGFVSAAFSGDNKPTRASLSSTAKTNGTAAQFDSAFGVEYEIHLVNALNGIKTLLELASRPNSSGDLLFTLRLNYNASRLELFADGLAVDLYASDSKLVELRDDAGRSIFTMPAPLIWDSPDPYYDDSTKEWISDWGTVDYLPTSFFVSTANNLTTVTVAVPAKYLNASTTRYPVFVDPSLGPTISTSVEVDDQIVYQESALSIVSGGTLKLVNSSLIFNGNYAFTVYAGAKLELINSTITVNSTPGQHITMSVSGQMYANFSTIAYTLTGIQVSSPVFFLNHSTVRNSFGNGVVLNSGTGQQILNSTVTSNNVNGVWGANSVTGVRISDSTISSNGAGGVFFLTGTGLEVVRTTFQSNGGNALSFAGAAATTLESNQFYSNFVAVAISASTNYLDNSTIDGSTLWDYSITGGTLWSRSTWFSRPKVTTSGPGKLVAQWRLNLTVVDAGGNAVGSQAVTIYNRTGASIASGNTNASGFFSALVTEFNLTASAREFYSPHTVNYGAAAEDQGVPLDVDGNRTLTLRQGGDADGDGAPNANESNSESHWFEAEHWAPKLAWIANDTAAADSKAVQPSGISANDDFLQTSNWDAYLAGNYLAYYRLKSTAGDSNATVTLRVDGVGGQLAARTLSFNDSSYAWFSLGPFSTGGSGNVTLKPRILAGANAAYVFADRLMLVRVTDGSADLNRSYAFSDWLRPDTDGDGAPDGIELVKANHWREAEALVTSPVDDAIAANRQAASHPDNTALVATLAISDYFPAGDYQFWIKARSTNGSSSYGITIDLDGTAASPSDLNGTATSRYLWFHTGNFSVGSGGAHTIVAHVNDSGDPALGDANDFLLLDKMLIWKAVDFVGGDFAPVRVSDVFDTDTDRDGLLDSLEEFGFFNADFANASEGEIASGTVLYGRAVGLEDSADWFNVSVPVRRPGDYRFYIPPQILLMDGQVEARRNLTEWVLNATLTDEANGSIAYTTNSSFVYMGSSSPPMQGGLMQLAGWYSWVFPDLHAGTYHLRVSVDSAAASLIGQFAVLVDRIYVQKQILAPLNSDTDEDGVSDGAEVGARMFPLNVDSDYDHLSDLEETTAGADEFVTDPLLNDTDADGVVDAVEVGGWGDTDPNTTTDPTNSDTDGDGIPDGWVDGWSYGKDVAGEANPIAMKDGLKQPWEGEDLDGDGAVKAGAFEVNRENSALAAGGETDPNARDTDNDGMPDGWELWPRAFNESGGGSGNDPLILDPLANDSENDSDVKRTDFSADPDGLTNLQEYLSGTNPLFGDTDQDYARDGQEANVTLRTVVAVGFHNTTNFASVNANAWVYYDKNPYDGITGRAYWWNHSDHNVSENYAGALFAGAVLLHTTTDGGAVLYNPSLDAIYVWEAGSEYAYTGIDSYHNGTVHVFLNGTLSGINTAAHAQRGFQFQEFLGGVDPLNPDSDGDTILDGWDGPYYGTTNGWGEDRDGDGLVNALDTDSDGDGVSDGSEFPQGNATFMPELGASNPYDPDTDHDGISDFSDTRPLDYDNDGETGWGAFSDAWGSWVAFGGKEAAYCNATLNRCLAWNNSDTDGDGIPDGAEDVDHSGSRGANETDALDVDSDDDGLWDGPDVYYGAVVRVEAENGSARTPGIAIQASSGASAGNYSNWTGYLETSSWSITASPAYYRLDLAIADDSAPSNTTMTGANVTVEVYLDGVLLNVSRLSVNPSVHLPSVQLASVSALPVWNSSAHVLSITVIRGDQDYRFHLDYIQLAPYHPGEWNVSASALRNDSDGDEVRDGAERGLVEALVQTNTSTALGTDLSKFFFAPYLALSSTAANDTDGDGLSDGYERLVNSTVLEAEASQYANATLQSGGGISTLKTTTSATSNASMTFKVFLEPGFYELRATAKRGSECQPPAPQNCSAASFQTDVLLAGAFVGRGQFQLSDSSWAVVLAGAFVVRQRGVYDLTVMERYNWSYAYRFEVDSFALRYFSVGERWLYLNPSDPDTDRDLVADGAEFLRMTDPLSRDTDNDTVVDGQEAPFLGDFDGSTWNETGPGYLNSTDAHDTDRDNDGWPDGDVNESTVVFRTNATRGMYNETDVWIAVDLNGTGTLTTFKYDAWVGINYSNTTAVSFRTRFGGNVSRNTTTPEGYSLFKNGSWVFIDLPGSIDVRFVAASGGPIPANATNTSISASFMLANRESLNWSLMLNTDPDDDGLIGADDPCPYVFDCDGDGIGDGEERANGTNITNPDSDGDGLWDGPTVAAHIGEWVNGSNALMNDSDLDGLLDGPWNATTGQLGEFNLSTDPTRWDTDGDGMPDLWEFTNGLNATNATDGWMDKDHDGLANTLEYAFARPETWAENLNGTFWNGTNASFWDSDHDGLPDGWEWRYGLNPLNASDKLTDNDLDGLNATTEYMLGRPGNWNEATQGAYWNGSNPATNDTDGDGIVDPNERNNGIYDPDGDGKNNWGDLDSDGDQLNDSNEHFGWDADVWAWPSWWNLTGLNQSQLAHRHVDSNPYIADTDSDGVSDYLEHLNGTDPREQDTDFDGYNDSSESPENRTWPEIDRPEILAWNVTESRLCWDPTSCGITFNPGEAVFRGMLAEYFFDVAITVHDGAGLRRVAVTSFKATDAADLDCVYYGPSGYKDDTCHLRFYVGLGGKSEIEFSNLWRVFVEDRNGNVNSTQFRTGWGAGIVTWTGQSISALWGSDAAADPYMVGMSEGVMEGLLQFAWGMVVGPLGYLDQNSAPLREAETPGGWHKAEQAAADTTNASAALARVLASFQINFLGPLGDWVYQIAAGEGQIFDPYEPNETDLTAFQDAALLHYSGPVVWLLMNATFDEFCKTGSDRACLGPGNSSNWSKFLAGHAAGVVLGTIAALVISIVVPEAGAELLAADAARGAEGLSGVLSDAARVAPRLDPAIFDGFAGDAGRMGNLESYVNLERLKVPMGWQSVEDAAVRLGAGNSERGMADAEAAAGKLFSPEFGTAGRIPSWMLEDGELLPEYQNLFDGLAPWARDVDADGLRGMAEVGDTYPEFLDSPLPGQFQGGDVAKGSEFYGWARDNGMTHEDFMAAFTEPQSGRFTLRLDPPPTPETVAGRPVRLYTIEDGTQGGKRVMFDRMPNGNWRYDGPVGTKSMNAAQFDAKLGSSELSEWKEPMGEMRDLINVRDNQANLGGRAQGWKTNTRPEGTDLWAENPTNPNGITAIGDGGHNAGDTGGKLGRDLGNGGRLDTNTNQLDVLDSNADDFLDKTSGRMPDSPGEDAIRFKLDPNGPPKDNLAGDWFVEDFNDAAAGTGFKAQIGANPETGWTSIYITDGQNHVWWVRFHFWTVPPL